MYAQMKDKSTGDIVIQITNNLRLFFAGFDAYVSHRFFIYIKPIPNPFNQEKKYIYHDL